ncbi:MAG: hypothetical protein A4E51_01390 [Methanosaeta sp. PtaU1.Bin055]|nr:MAG: hypothetical protein A4E51_01390 [Methanosaeta sp. PtaU1.Bin055]
MILESALAVSCSSTSSRTARSFGWSTSIRARSPTASSTLGSSMILLAALLPPLDSASEASRSRYRERESTPCVSASSTACFSFRTSARTETAW